MNAKKKVTLKSNKKAVLTLHALVSILITILTFWPIVSFGSQLLSTNQQAEDSFDNVVAYLTQLQKEEQGASESDFLILDEGTAAVYFDSDKPMYLRILPFHNNFPPDTQVGHFFFERPLGCDQDGNEGMPCICLFSKTSSQTHFYSEYYNHKYQANTGTNYHYITATQASCEPLDLELKIDSCTIGFLDNNFPVTMQYFCEEGFIIPRGIFEEFHDHYIFTSLSLDRREHLLMQKQADNTIRISPGSIYQATVAKEHEERFNVLANARVELNIAQN